MFATNSTFGETSISNLIFTLAKEDHGKRIYCNVSNGYGQIISDFTPLINILRYPTKPVTFLNGSLLGNNVSVIENQTVNLVCNSEGNPWPAVSWVTPWSTSGNKTFLRIPVIHMNNSGVYTCTSNSVLSPTDGKTINMTISNNMSIDVLYPPRFPLCSIKNRSVEEYEIRAIENEPFTMSCQSNSNPQPSYTWTLPYVENVSGQKLSIASLKPVGKNIYSIRVDNIMSASFQQSVEGSVERRFTLDILSHPSRPVILSNGRDVPDTITVIQNETVNLTCKSEGNPSPTISWINPMLLSENKAVLTKQHVQTSDAGLYVCKSQSTLSPTNGHGIEAIRTFNVSLDILFPPKPPLLRFTTCSEVFFEQHLKVIEGQSINVSCTTSSKPDSSYTWTSNITRTRKDLILKNITVDQNGAYSCTATNVMNTTYGGTVNGEMTSTFHLDVLGKPGVPDTFRIAKDSVTERSLTVEWKPGFDGGENQWFVIGYKTKADETWTLETAPEPVNRMTIDGLVAGTYYEVKMYAENSVGQSKMTPVLTVITKVAKQGNPSPASHYDDLVSIQAEDPPASSRSKDEACKIGHTCIWAN